MKCNCNKSCIKNKKETLLDIDNRYMPCAECSTKTLKKAIPLKRQIKLSKITQNYLKCEKCGKRHIDIVMAHVLKILIEETQISESSSIRKVGTPLITPAINLNGLPYLSENSLVLITTNSNKETADKILSQVPEIKAVIRGDTNEVVGQVDENSMINNYDLLSGCDVRCDIQNTDVGSILIYKNQSKIHIEYPKEESPKIQQLKEVLEKYENPVVFDSMCGPGTLGIYALLKNARKVVFNDIYDHSLDSLKTNLLINEIPEEKYEIIHEDLLKLDGALSYDFDVGIIDAFPGVNTQKYCSVLEKICNEVIII